ncbi:MAG: D-Ala-D-Ala carboxypeptidase family metallohydrolase [Desulfovibrionaceae bacterium]
MADPDFSNIKHFTRQELACKCGCGLCNTRQSSLERLERARVRAGVGFAINSACRCPQHNIAEGGKPNGAHPNGTAFDIEAKDSRTRFQVVAACLAEGFHRVGIGKTFVHVDDDEALPPNVVWLY